VIVLTVIIDKRSAGLK